MSQGQGQGGALKPRSEFSPLKLKAGDRGQRGALRKVMSESGGKLWIQVFLQGSGSGQAREVQRYFRMIPKWLSVYIK